MEVPSASLPPQIADQVAALPKDFAADTDPANEHVATPQSQDLRSRHRSTTRADTSGERGVGKAGVEVIARIFAMRP
jgi:hypothetical protein